MPNAKKGTARCVTLNGDTHLVRSFFLSVSPECRSLRAIKKKKQMLLIEHLFFARAKLLRALLLCNYLNTVVVSASLAYAVSKVYFAALRASNKVGGLLKLPNAGASLHLSGMRNLFLWYCHC